MHHFLIRAMPFLDLHAVRRAEFAMIRCEHDDGGLAQPGFLQ